MQGTNRADPTLVREALAALDRLAPPAPSPEKENQDVPAAVRDAAEALTALQEGIRQTREETSSIFDFAHLKRVAGRLDWRATPRMARDGSKDIAIHSSKLPDENLKYRIFDFATRVTNYSKLSATMRAETIQLCAQILFYDHGYKAVAGISKLDSNWRKRMEASYQNGDETHPLRGLYKGSKKYTDKFDAEHPGGVLKYFRYAQMILGNQASYEDIAKVMNNKANKDGVTVNGNPPKFNSKSVCR